MDEGEWLAQRFDAHRAHLQAVAFRLLGSTTEADDAVQETWLRVSRAGTSGVENLGGWLTTVVSRVCLNMLESRHARREEPLDLHAPGPVVRGTGGPRWRRGSSPAARDAVCRARGRHPRPIARASAPSWRRSWPPRAPAISAR